MAKIERKVQKIFGGNLSPAGNIAIYGTKEAGSPSFSDNVETIQSLSWLQGILGAVSPAKAPYIEDLNGVFYVITKQLAYLFQAGVAEWNSSTEYYTNSICQYNGKIYVAIQNSTNQAPTQTAYWIEYTELFTKYLPTMFNSTVSSTIGGYPSGAILDYTDGSGNTFKIQSLIANNTNAPTDSNIKFDNSGVGTYYWKALSMKPSNEATVIKTWKSNDRNSWYRIWSDGFIEQAGASQTIGRNATASVTLHTAMTTTTYNVQITPGITTAAVGNERAVWNINSRATTSFSIFNNNEQKEVWFLWRVAGY